MRSIRVSCDLLLQVRRHAVAGSTADITIIEVDEAVEQQDPTGGRGVNREPSSKLAVKGQIEKEVLESAV